MTGDEAAGAVARVTEATRADLPRVVEIERQCFSDPWSATSFREALAGGPLYFACARAVAEEDDQRGGADAVLGYVVAWFAADEGEVANLAVAPEARGRGVGGRLLDAALAEGARRGAAAVYLEVRTSNLRARQLYESRGFVEVGRRRNYYQRPREDAVVLRRTIRSAVGSVSS